MIRPGRRELRRDGRGHNVRIGATESIYKLVQVGLQTLTKFLSIHAEFLSDNLASIENVREMLDEDQTLLECRVRAFARGENVHDQSEDVVRDMRWVGEQDLLLNRSRRFLLTFRLRRLRRLHWSNRSHFVRYCENE